MVTACSDDAMRVKLDVVRNKLVPSDWSKKVERNARRIAINKNNPTNTFLPIIRNMIHPETMRKIRALLEYVRNIAIKERTPHRERNQEKRFLLSLSRNKMPKKRKYITKNAPTKFGSRNVLNIR